MQSEQLQPNPTVAAQILNEAQSEQQQPNYAETGIAGVVPEEYNPEFAAGGIIAFADGGPTGDYRSMGEKLKELYDQKAIDEFNATGKYKESPLGKIEKQYKGLYPEGELAPTSGGFPDIAPQRQNWVPYREPAPTITRPTRPTDLEEALKAARDRIAAQGNKPYTPEEPVAPGVSAETPSRESLWSGTKYGEAITPEETAGIAGLSRLGKIGRAHV